MQDPKTYKQCSLSHPATRRKDVVWIPSKFAFKGKSLQIRPTPDTEFEDGWLVEAVYPTVWNQENAENSRKNQKRFEHVLGK